MSHALRAYFCPQASYRGIMRPCTVYILSASSGYIHAQSINDTSQHANHIRDHVIIFTRHVLPYRNIWATIPVLIPYRPEDSPNHFRIIWLQLRRQAVPIWCFSYFWIVLTAYTARGHAYMYESMNHHRHTVITLQLALYPPYSNHLIVSTAITWRSLPILPVDMLLPLEA